MVVSFLLRPVAFLFACCIVVGLAPTLANAQSSSIPITVSDNTIQAAPQIVRFGDLLDRLSLKDKQELEVSPQSKISGVQLFISFRDANHEQVKSSLQSFFSHKDARSYWQKNSSTDVFHLSSRYGENTLNKEYWSRQLLSLFDQAVDGNKRDNNTPDALLQKELAQPNTIASAKLMDSLFSRSQIERILRGEEKMVTADIEALEGSKKQEVSALYEQSRITYPKDTTETDQRKLTFLVEEDSNGLTRSVSVLVKVRDGVSTGLSHFGTGLESLAKSEIKDMWQIGGDLPLEDIAASSVNGSIEHATMYAAFADVSKRFSVSLLAVLPRSNGKVKIDANSLEKSLQLIEQQSEPLLVKRRGDIVLVCPVSFIGNNGVNAAVPLATVHTLHAVEKSGKVGMEELLKYARIAEVSSEQQIEANGAEFPVLRVVQSWQPFLRLLNKKVPLDLQQPIVTDEQAANALNVILKKSDALSTTVTPRQFVTVEETIFPLLLDNVLPKGFPKDYLVRHSLSLQIKDGAGTILNHTEADYMTVAPQYRDKEFPESP